MSSWRAYLTDNQARFENELLDFISIPSISALKECKQHVAQAAEWVKDKLEQIGMQNCRLLPTGGHPAVYADWCHLPNRPTVLVYGHYDVQPADPLELWDHDPFCPVIENGRIIGRGASDDKGNMLIPIIALESLFATSGTLPINVKCFFEGQEEIGSPGMSELIAANADLFACDLVLNADSVQWSTDQPAVILGLRGLIGLQIELRAAERDVHSGAFGGTFLNPLHAMSKLVASLHNPDGSVAVNGFYDDVRPVSKTEQGLLSQIPFDENSFKRNLGLSGLWGEPGYSTLQRSWHRPCLDLNGIWGGFQGQGLKTIIPARAYAKLSCRLVPEQDPLRIVKLLQNHLHAKCPDKVKLGITTFGSMALPYHVPYDHAGNRAALRVLEKVYGRPPLPLWMGFSVPVCGWFLKHLNAYTIGFGFGLDDECIHAPNEFFRLESFAKGQQAWCFMLQELGDYRGQ